jgi:CcmD family protein
VNSQTPTPSVSPTTTTAEDRSTSFRAVQGGNEMQSGEKLLVEAYAVIWLVLFGLVLLSWRRQRKIDDRVSSLEGALAAARTQASRDKARNAGGD